jgi:hypothetical protein
LPGERPPSYNRWAFLFGVENAMRRGAPSDEQKWDAKSAEKLVNKIPLL